MEKEILVIDLSESFLKYCAEKEMNMKEYYKNRKTFKDINGRVGVKISEDEHSFLGLFGNGITIYGDSNINQTIIEKISISNFLDCSLAYYDYEGDVIDVVFGTAEKLVSENLNKDKIKNDIKTNAIIQKDSFDEHLYAWGKLESDSTIIRKFSSSHYVTNINPPVIKYANPDDWFSIQDNWFGKDWQVIDNDFNGGLLVKWYDASSLTRHFKDGRYMSGFYDAKKPDLPNPILTDYEKAFGKWE